VTALFRTCPLRKSALANQIKKKYTGETTSFLRNFARKVKFISRPTPDMTGYMERRVGA
jgi:hypothetical protein